MRILVTGGSGFIGINLIEEAIKRKHIIYNVDNLTLFSNDYNASHENYYFSKIDIKNCESESYSEGLPLKYKK